MANSDKLWFDMGVRDNVSRTLTDILYKAEELKDVMDSMTIGRDAIKNAHDIEQALDKIAVARDRIAESRSKTSDRNELETLKKMDRELAKIQKRFENLGRGDTDITKAMLGTEGYADFLKLAQGLVIALDQVKRKTGEINAAAIEKERNDAREANRLDVLKEKYYELARARMSLQDSILNAAPGSDTTDAVSLLNSISARMGAVRRAINSGGSTPQSVIGSDFSEFLRKVRDETRNLSGATDDYNRTLTTTESIQRSLTKMKLDAESQQRIAQIRKQSTEYAALGQKITDITNLINRLANEEAGLKSGAITTPIMTRDVVSTELDAIQRRYNEAIASGKQLEKEDAEAKKQRANASKKATEAIQLLSHANQGLISSYNRIAEAGSRANRITIQFQNQLAGYAGLYGIERILKSVITIGGQFEYQHIALQNILGDIQQANTLFSQLQDLAIESPKTFMELTNYTKQLSAYQIPYDELFDTTKRLADLSTGLGVDMSRLILAYGQVRSAAVLRGQELRQFTEAGIPIVQALADEFTKLNGKVVTTADVFELISKRAVPFEMVKKILFDMTDEGGRFYNMQSELANTLYGKWQKLQDQWQITLGHIADAKSVTGSFLKGTLEYIVKIVSALDKMTPMLGTLAIYKLSRGVVGGLRDYVNKETGKTAIDNMSLAKLKEATRLERERLWYGKELTEQEKRIVMERSKLVSSDYALLAAEGQIDAKKTHQLYLEGKLKAAEYQRLLISKGYTAEQVKQIMHGNTKLLKDYSGLGGKISSGLWGLVGGWTGIAVSSIGAIFSLIGNANDKANEAKDIAKGANNEILQDLKSVNDLYNEFTKKSPSGTEDITSAIERMSNALKTSGWYTDELNRKIEGTYDSKERYSILYEQLQKVSAEYLRMKDNADAYLESANRVGEGNWFTRMFNDTMSKDIKQWGEANVDVKVAAKMLDKESAVLKDALEKFLKLREQWNDEMRKQSLSDLLKLPNVNTEHFANYLKNDRKRDWEKEIESIYKYVDAINTLSSKESEVDSQMEEYFTKIEMYAEEYAKSNNLNLADIAKWDDKDLRKFKNWLDEIINSYHVDADTGDKLRDKILSFMPKEVAVKVKAIPSLDKEPLAEWQQDLKKYFEEKKLNIPIDAKTSLEQVEKELQNKKKEMQEQLDRSKGILIKVGLDLSNLPKTDEELYSMVPFFKRNLIKKALGDYKEANSEISKINQSGADLGLTVDKKTKKTGGSKKDKVLEDAKVRLEEVKKFYAEYKKYREVYKDDAKAQSMVEAVFGMKSGEGDKIVKDYKGTIQGIIDAFKNSKGERKKFFLSGKQLLGDIDIEKTKKVIDEALRETQEYISKQTEKWNIYKQILEKTGDKEYAKNAFVDKRIFDDAARELEKKLVEVSNGAPIDYTMSQVAAEKYYKDNKEALELWKKIIDLTSHNWVDALTKGADAYSKLLTVSEKIKKNEKEIERLRNEGAGVPGNDARIKALQKDNEKNYYEQFQRGSDYLRFFGAVLTMTNDEINSTAQTIRQRLITELSRGTISAHQYTKSIKEVNDQFKKGYKAPKSDFGTFLESGQKGLVDKRNDEVQNAAIRLELARKEVEELQKRQEKGEEVSMEELMAADAEFALAQQEVENATKALNISQAQYDTLSDMSMALQGVIGFLDGVKKAMEDLSQMFDALGNEHAANDFSDMADAAAGISSVLKPVDNVVKSIMNGDISGAVSNALVAPVEMVTAPVTAFAKLHDKQLQRNIDSSKRLQEAYERTAKNLETVLGRTLGGVYSMRISGDEKKALQAYYNDYSRPGNRFKGNGTKEALDKAIETESYYDSQLAMLMAQRDELTWQLNREEKKKKTDSDAVTEYKQQIKELDDQIQNFALDMAKSLYDIDVKSWAKELTDAIVGAWESGEDAVEAYKDKVKDIMKTLTTNILSQKVMEKALEKVGLDKLIGNLMIDTSGQLDEKSVELIADKMMTAGEISANTITAILDQMEAKGYISKGDSKTSSRVIQGGFTENETGLLLSYVNAIRADLSIQRVDVNAIRLNIESLVSRGNFLTMAQENNLRSIADNTLRNAEAADRIETLLRRATQDKSFGFYLQ